MSDIEAEREQMPKPQHEPGPKEARSQRGGQGVRGERCIRCDYDLAGLPEAAACPECGMAAPRSQGSSALLRSADPRWLGLVERGLRDLAMAMGVLFGATVVLLLLVAAHTIGLSVWGARAPKIVESIVDVSAVLVLLGVAVLHMRGCLLSTLQSHSDFAAAVWVRGIVRYCGILLPLTIGGMFVVRQEIAQYSATVVLFVRTAIEINAVAFFFGLAAMLEHYERRTVAWNVERRQRHRQMRINLGLLVALIVVNDWLLVLPIIGLLVAGLPLLLIGTAYFLFGSAVGRVQSEVLMEHVIAREVAGERGEVPDDAAGL